MVALRAFFSNLLSKLFRRRGEKGELALMGPASVPPPIRWKLALTCFAIFTALLFVPEMRQALSTVAFTWKEAFKPARFKTYSHRQDETARWEKIGREAEARGDAAAMAFAAMRLANPEGGHLEEAVRLDKLAVTKDPSLTWTYYFLAPRVGHRQFTGAPHPELLQALRQWDSDNAAPLIATAEDAALERQVFDMPPPREQTNERYLVDAEKYGPQWREWMDRAFAAPVYVDYVGRRLDLDRRLMRQFSINDPIGTLAADGYDLRSPNLYLLHAYAELRFAQGEEYEHASKWDQAANQYWSVVDFAQRMRLREDADMAGAYFEQDAFERLSRVLPKLGRPQEAHAIGMAAQEEYRDAIGAHYFLTPSSGLWVHIWVLLTVFSGLSTAVALAMFAVKPSRSPLVRFGLSYTSLLLVVSSAGLLLAYHPYVQGFSRFLDDPRGGRAETAVSDSYFALGGFNDLFEVPMKFQWWVWANGRMLFWWAMVATVATACIWLASRAVRHRRA